MSIEDVISDWRLLSIAEKGEVIDHLKHLYDAGVMEKSFNKESEETTSRFNAKSGNDSNRTEHIIRCADFLLEETIAKLGKNKVDLVFTSPPYNSGVQYGECVNDNKSIEDYIRFLCDAMRNCDALLKGGGRLVINIRDIAIGKGKRLPIIVPLYDFLVKEGSYFYRGLHIWYKGREESSTGWGSWRSASSPSIIDLYEWVFVFQKKGNRKKGKDNLGKTEFVEDVIGVWKIRPVKKITSKKKKNVVDHPCPFPVELAKRVIKLYSHVGDLVLDPFAGISTTSMAAIQSGRNSICVEINKDYCDVGWKKLQKLYGGGLMFSNVELKKTIDN